MNVYDFDETIFDGDSESLFWNEILKLDEVGLEHKEMIKEAWKDGDDIFFDRVKEMYWIVKDVKDIDSLLERLWDKNEGRVKSFYARIRKEDDVISSATPRFILAPLMKRLGFKNLIATELEENTYKPLHINKGEGKVLSFKKKYPNSQIDSFYSDSDSDLPLARLSKHPYKVEKDVISPWIIE